MPCWCHNKRVTSYRDKYNPEALHFPGSFVSRTFLTCSIFFCVCLLVGLALMGTTLDRTLNIAFVLVVVGLALAAWPKEILLDQRGLTQRHGSERRLLAWEDVGVVELTSEFRLPLRRETLPTVTLRVKSKDGRHTVVQTPRHPDTHRFAFELQRHGAKLPEELGHVTAPNLGHLSSAKDPMPEGLNRR